MAEPRGVAKVSEAKKLDIAQRRTKIARYIEMGIRNQNQMKEMLAQSGYDISAATISRDVKALQSEYHEASTALINHEKGVSLRRLERYVAKLQTKIQEGDVRAIRLAKELEETRAKLLGLYMPAKIAHTNPEGDKEYTGIPEDLKRKMFERVAEEEAEIVDAEVIEELPAGA